jgi:hypothetical protein
MNDLNEINRLNAEATARSWKPTHDYPHAVVHKIGLNVLEVHPAITRGHAEALAIKLANPLTGETATVL